METQFNTTNLRPSMASLDLQVFTGLAHTMQTAAIAALIFVAVTFAPKLKRRVQLARIPVLPVFGTSNGSVQSTRSMFQEGYQKFKDSVYIIITPDGEDSVIVPTALMPELRKLPDDVLSFPKAVERLMEAKYTRIATEAKLAAHAIKSDLTPALSRLNATISDEVDAAMRQYLPSCDDWTELDINRKLIDIVTRISGRVFVGPELCQDPEYLDIGANYTIYLMDAIHAIKRLRPWQKPFLAPRLPEMKKLRAIEKRAAEQLGPIVKERLEAEKNDPNWQKPEDMMQWLINHSAGAIPADEIAHVQLSLIFAAIHTTTTTATNILYTLAVTPECMEPLREEIRTAMHENGGQLTSKALQQMLKLDSYMKEVIRVHALSVSSFMRRVVKGITLSNGQYIPPGVIIEFPGDAVYSDEAFYPSPNTFDPWRSSNIRQNGTPIDHARNQFVTTNETNLLFGYGRHACPGRFFAANEIKLILARLILDYEIKMPKGQTERYASIEIGRTLIPAPDKTIMLKRVEI